MRTATAGTTKLTFLAADHHGTSSLAIDASTFTYAKHYTTPFGTPRGTTTTAWPDDKGFLGAPIDPGTGLTHIGAREYDPVIGAFLSVDPLLETGKPQTLNGYSYSSNNPTTNSDPTGLGNADCMTGVMEHCTNGVPGRGSVYHPERERHSGCSVGCGTVDWSGTAHTSSRGQTMSDGNSNLACAVGRCISFNLGPSDFERNVGNASAHLLFGAGHPFTITLDIVGLLFTPACALEGECLTAKYDAWGVRHGLDPDSAFVALGMSLPFGRLQGRSGPEIGPSWFPRGSGKIPSGWSSPEMTRKFRKNPAKEGFVWRAPKGRDSVRIDKGDPNSKWATQQVDHVVINSNGRIVGRGGELLPQNSKVQDYPVEAHIPLSEWQKWRTWDAP
ncbi:RHS repeat domain-containing protein [Streptomyces platensis]|uniref:RHS repeat domain-containing protein n=1 Tax=Streptomyces platensis TaxID=58346 RepID=UPI003C2C7255